jgi:uncharacterized protein YecE (DUF72 family)
MGLILIGTSGYDYQEWRDVFYPAGVRKDDFLAFYADQFNALELNFSFYSMPKAANLAKMAEKTSGKVKFSIKGNQEFTHHIEVGHWRGVVKEFRESLYPFLKEEVLLSVLLQFPQSFHYDRDRRLYLADLIREFGDVPLVAEFRHESWQRQAVYDGLSERGVGLCLCDMPDIRALPKFAPVVTGNVAYLRFHGKNKDSWYGTNARDRYSYLYSDEELAAYAPVLREISSKAAVTQVYFNNHARGAATRNAKKMAALLSEG